MAIVTCSVGEDGNLTPLTIEFESGDLLDIGQGEPGDLVEVRRPFGLDAITADSDQLTIPAILNVRPAPKLPPPPPEDGAFKRSHQASNSIKIVLSATA